MHIPFDATQDEILDMLFDNYIFRGFHVHVVRIMVTLHLRIVTLPLSEIQNFIIIAKYHVLQIPC